MSLMRWLAACSSLKSVEDRPSRYKLTQENLVPRFGPKTAKRAGMVKRVLGWLEEWMIEPSRPVGRRLRALCRPPRLLAGVKKRSKTPVQAELVMDTVRVMRNDLRDEGLLRAKRRGQPWGRVAARIFGQSKA